FKAMPLSEIKRTRLRCAKTRFDRALSPGGEEFRQTFGWRPIQQVLQNGFELHKKGALEGTTLFVLSGRVVIPPNSHSRSYLPGALDRTVSSVPVGSSRLFLPVPRCFQRGLFGSSG